MQTTTTRSPAGPGADPEAVIREARRRQRRRHLATGTAVIAALAATAATLAAVTAGGRPGSGGQPRPNARADGLRVTLPKLPGGTGTTVLMWPIVTGGGYPTFTPSGGPPAYVGDLSTGQRAVRHLPGIAGGDFQPYLVGAGQRIVYVGGAGTTVMPVTLTGKPRVLGSTPFFAPAADAGHVWLVRYRNWRLNRGPIRVRSVRITGGPPGPASTLPPAVTRVIRGTDAGLLVELHRNNQDLALWHAGRALHRLPDSRGYAGLTADARLVAYGSDCRTTVTAATAAEPGTAYVACGVLRVVNVVTGALRSFPAPQGMAGWLPDNGFNNVSAISPGGGLIAAYAGVPPLRQGWSRLYLLRLAGAAQPPRPVPSSATPVYASTAWSATGSWLLYRGAGGHLWAYQASTGRIVTSSTPCCRFTMITVPRGPG